MTRKKKPREEVSAGGIVFRRDGERTFYLLIRDPYRNWGFPKGHLEAGEEPAAAALREVAEETGIGDVAIHSAVETIDWTFRFRGRKIHKTCHFFLMETSQRRTAPQSAEGITACRWATYDQATKIYRLRQRARRARVGARDAAGRRGVQRRQRRTRELSDA